MNKIRKFEIRFLLSLFASTISIIAHSSIDERYLNKSEWLADCYAVRANMMEMHWEFGVNQFEKIQVKESLLDDSSETDLRRGSINIGTIWLPILVSNFDRVEFEDENDQQLFSISNESEFLFVNRYEPIVVTDIFTYDQESSLSTVGYKESNLRALTSDIFDGAPRYFELRMASITAKPEQLRCHEDSIKNDLRIYFLLKNRIFEDRIDKAFLIGGLGFKGFGILSERNSMNELEIALFSSEASYSIRYGFSANTVSVLFHIAKALGGQGLLEPD